MCTDWDPAVPAPITAALTDWENVLPGTQFSQGACGANPIRIQRASTTARPDSCPAFACACVTWRVEPSDAQRGGRYTLAESRVWVDDLRNGGDAYDDNGLRYLVAHELGHIFGLHEAYNHDPQYSAGSISCKDDTAASVMDSVITSTGRTVNGCDGVSPTARDIGLVQALYSLAPPAAPTTIFQAGPDTAVRFRDDNAAEEGYGVIVERWSGSGWIFTDSRFLTNSIAPCSTVPCGQDRTVYYRKPDGPLNDGDRRPRAAPW